MPRSRAVIASLAGGLTLWALLGGSPNSDTLWALSWGRQLAGGRVPALAAPGAPTPHPLTTALGALLAPLGSGLADRVAVAGCLVALAALAMIVFALGRAWFGPAAGALAALLVLTRPELLSFGARAYMDVPYLVLVLGALLLETRRPRAGAPVVGLLMLAGLLRPEAWLFSTLYLVWLGRGRGAGEADRRSAWRLAPLALAAPLMWMGMDLAATGDPLHSLLGTRAAAAALGRAHGPGAVLTAIPGRLSAVLGAGLLAAATIALVAAPRWRRDRLGPASLAGAASLVACGAVAAAGLPVITRYVLLPAMLAILVCAGGVMGWTALPAGDERRARWAACAALPLVLLALQLGFDGGRLAHARAEIAAQAPQPGSAPGMPNRDIARTR